MFGHKDIVEHLLSQKCELNRRDDLGVSSVMRASLNGDAAILKMLLKAGADVNIADLWGTTPLMGSVYHGRNQIAEELLKAGADQTTAMSNGKTVKEIAASIENNEAIKLLHKYN